MSPSKIIPTMRTRQIGGRWMTRVTSQSAGAGNGAMGWVMSAWLILSPGKGLSASGFAHCGQSLSSSSSRFVRVTVPESDTVFWTVTLPNGTAFQCDWMVQNPSLLGRAA